MMVMPLWLLKYCMVFSGLYVLFAEGQFYGLALAAIGGLWCAHNWSNGEK